MNEEIWKPIKGYEGYYEVSNFGNIRSIDRLVPFLHYSVHRKGRMMRLHTHRKGYLEVHLCKNGKERIFKVHRLVALAFIPNPLKLPQINHKDENPANNSVDNLEWCDNSYNINYGERNKRLSEKVGKKIYQYKSNGTLVGSYSSIRAAALKTGLKYSSIRSAALGIGHSKSAGGYIWVLSTDFNNLDCKLEEYKVSRSKQYKPLLCKDSCGNVIGFYKSLSEAHRATGLAKSTIMRYVHSKVKSPCGFWEHADLREEGYNIVTERTESVSPLTGNHVSYATYRLIE